MKLKHKMNIAGKVSGAFFGGLLSSNILGALLCGFLGHLLFDLEDDESEEQEYIIDDVVLPTNVNIVQSLLKLCIQLINLKNQMLCSEIDIIKEFFVEKLKFETKEINFIDNIIQNLINNNIEINVTECNNCINSYCNENDKLDIIQLLFLVAISDGPIDDEELKYILEEAQALKISSKDFNFIKNYYIQEEVDFFTVLGVTKDATDDEIKSAFRKHIIRLHPDKNNGNYDKAQFQKIVNAYNEIKKSKK